MNQSGQHRCEEVAGVGCDFSAIVDVEVAAEEAEELASTRLAWLVKTGVVATADCVFRNEVTTEGLQIVTGRTVFYSMTGEYQVTCPHCAWWTDPACSQINSGGQWPALYHGVLDAPLRPLRHRGDRELGLFSQSPTTLSTEYSWSARIPHQMKSECTLYFVAEVG